MLGFMPMCSADLSPDYACFRVHLKLLFAEPMFCIPVAFTKTTGIAKMTKTIRQPQARGLTAGLAEITGITDMTTKKDWNPGVQSTGSQKKGKNSTEAFAAESACRQSQHHVPPPPRCVPAVESGTLLLGICGDRACNPRVPSQTRIPAPEFYKCLSHTTSPASFLSFENTFAPVLLGQRQVLAPSTFSLLPKHFS